VLYFAKKIRLDVGVVSHTAKAWIACRTREDFVILHSMVQYFDEADWTDMANASRESSVVTQHKDVQRSATYARSLRNETVVAGIVNRKIERLNGMKGLRMSIVPGDSSLCGFNNRSNNVRRVLT
jgi:hypothetical protein